MPVPFERVACIAPVGDPVDLPEQCIDSIARFPELFRRACDLPLPRRRPFSWRRWHSRVGRSEKIDGKCYPSQVLQLSTGWRLISLADRAETVVRGVLRHYADRLCGRRGPCGLPRPEVHR